MLLNLEDVVCAALLGRKNNLLGQLLWRSLMVQLTFSVMRRPVEPVKVITAEHLVRRSGGDLRRLVVAHDDLCYLSLARTHQDFLRYIVILDLRLVQESAIILLLVRQVVVDLRFLPLSRVSLILSRIGVLIIVEILL